MSFEHSKTFNINRIAILYRDLLSSNLKSLSDNDKSILLNIKPVNKIVAIGGIDSTNWNAYPLTYMLSNKLVAPTVLDESKVYQSWQAMRTHDESIVHPQTLISQCVVIKIIGYDNSPNINDYLNSFISMCVANDRCKLVFIVIDGNKKFYKDNIYIRKCNSTFIDTSKGVPYQIDSTPLCIKPDDIVFFNVTKKAMSNTESVKQTNVTSSKKRSSLSSLISSSDFI